MSVICASSTRLCIRQRSSTNPCHYRDLNNVPAFAPAVQLDSHAVPTGGAITRLTEDRESQAMDFKKTKKTAQFAVLGVMPGTRPPLSGQIPVIPSAGTSS